MNVCEHLNCNPDVGGLWRCIDCDELLTSVQVREIVEAGRERRSAREES